MATALELAFTMEAAVEAVRFAARVSIQRERFGLMLFSLTKKNTAPPSRTHP